MLALNNIEMIECMNYLLFQVTGKKWFIYCLSHARGHENKRYVNNKTLF